MPNARGLLVVMLVVLLVVIGSLSLSACPPAKNDAPPATCSKVGDSCTFAAGKLGLCVEPADGGSALICQSQH